MSEQIREQVSAFLDGELPSSETELLLKRLTRDAVLRESFGRYALIGEAIRGVSPGLMAQGFAARVNLAIDGEAVPAPSAAPLTRGPRWWRPFAGAAVAAGVAAVAVVALQERAITPGVTPNVAMTAQASPPPRLLTAHNTAVGRPGAVAPVAATAGASNAVPHEALSYVVPAAPRELRPDALPARLTGYVFAHSRYSSGLDLRGVMADMLVESEEQPAANEAASRTAP